MMKMTNNFNKPLFGCSETRRFVYLCISVLREINSCKTCRFLWFCWVWRSICKNGLVHIATFLIPVSFSFFKSYLNSKACRRWQRFNFLLLLRSSIMFTLALFMLFFVIARTRSFLGWRLWRCRGTTSCIAGGCGCGCGCSRCGRRRITWCSVWFLFLTLLFFVVV